MHIRRPGPDAGDRGATAIPEQFLEQLLAALRRAEVVRSTRGAGGGYALAAPPDQLTVGNVLRALSGPLVPTELVTGESDPQTRDIPEAVVVRGVWEGLRTALRQVADCTTLQDLLDRRAARASGQRLYDAHLMAPNRQRFRKRYTLCESTTIRPN